MVGQARLCCYVRMMMKMVKLIGVGDETGIVLPDEVLAVLGVQEGDSIDLVDLPDGVELRRIAPEPNEQIGVARKVMRRRRNALGNLSD
jgi:bifunctional DNA-binding transcriptional regulator/antitoxin component of YhaV-PrlF toxin-antitoxin module